MPSYDFECAECGEELYDQFFSSPNDPMPEICPHCGKKALKKVIRPTNFILKGGCWFRDGYSRTPTGKKK